MSALYRGPNRGYELTDSDTIALSRAFSGEAGEGRGKVSREEASALFWCWLDRLLLVNAVWNKSRWSLKQLICSHSQPMSKRWSTPGEDKCAQYPHLCGATEIARRQRIQNLSIATMEKWGTYQLAKEAQAGTLERVMPSATDFAACSLTRKQGRPCEGTNIGGNCFLTKACLKGSELSQLIPGEVVGGPAAHSTALKAGAVVVGAAVLILIGLRLLSE